MILTDEISKCRCGSGSGNLTVKLPEPQPWESEIHKVWESLANTTKEIEKLKEHLAKLEVIEEKEYLDKETTAPEFEIGGVYEHPEYMGWFLYAGIDQNKDHLFHPINLKYPSKYPTVYDIEELKKWRKVEK